MNDDLRVLVEEHLPRLAYQIMEPVSHMPSAQFVHRNRNWVHRESTDWDGRHTDGRLHYAGPQGDGYYYRGRNYNGDVINEWYVAFHALSLVDVSDEDPEPIQIDNSKVRILSIVDTQNDNASIRRIKANKSEAKDTSSEKTFAVLAEAEFETAMTRSAEASLGPIKGKSEFTAKFRSKVSASAGGAWRKSDRIEDHVHEAYDILPFTRRTMTIKEGEPSIHQKVPTRGLLDCKVEIGIFNCGEWWFDHYDDIVRCWSGLKAGWAPFDGWFVYHSVPQAEIDDWVRPYLNLDIEVRADRVRYFGKIDQERITPGHEEDYAAAKAAYFSSIAAGKR